MSDIKQMKKLRTVTVAVLMIAIFMSLLSGCAKQEKSADPMKLSWNEIAENAKSTEVNFYMWGGDTRINKWVDEYVAKEVKDRYGIKLNRVPMNAEDFMNKLANEKAAAKKNGSIDLLWINGENFYTAKENDMLYGPFADKLPNYNKYINKDASENAMDFGYPVEGYEVPYGRAQMVFIYDSSKIASPPKNFKALEEFIKANPGKFTYPAPPDFTGSAFVRNIMYYTTGGYDQYMKMSEKDIPGKIGAAWQYLNDIKPYLWRAGKTYPANVGQLDTMFADGEVLMSMTYMPLKPSGDVIKGVFPKQTKTFVLDEGTISNTHFLAIPKNASNKLGAMVVADFLESFDAQLSKLDPANWGDLPAFDTEKLTAEELSKLNSMDLGTATAKQEDMVKHRVPEIPSKLVPVIEEEWVKNVGKDE